MYISGLQTIIINLRTAYSNLTIDRNQIKNQVIQNNCANNYKGALVSFQIKKVSTPRFSGITDEFSKWAERELKNHYSGTMHESGVPCQICRYYCRHCGMHGDVMEEFSCTATCKLEYFNLSGNLSSSRFIRSVI